MIAIEKRDVREVARALRPIRFREPLPVAMVLARLR
jgi:hypothetical protein